MNRRLQEFFNARAADCHVVTHPEAFTAQEQAATADTSGWSWAKVVVVKERDGFVLAVLSACCAVDLNRLKGLIGHGEIRLATVDEIRRMIRDSEPGAIPPFGELFGLRTFVDHTLINRREITFPAGDHRTAIRMRATEFLRLSAARVGHFAVPESAASPAR